MPRNGSGNYTLPQPAFVTGTKISSSAMNSDLSDIAAALTQSVSADGQTPLTGPIKMPSGTVAGPGITFNADVTTGFWLNASGQIGVAVGGVQTAIFNADKSVTWAGAATFSQAINLNGTTYTFGAGAANAFQASLNQFVDITVVFDGGGSVITNGKTIYLHLPFSITLTSFRLIADQSGSIVFDVLKAHAAVPVSSMVGSGNKPTLSSAQINVGTVISGWTSTTLVYDDWIALQVSGVPTNVEQVTVILEGSRTTPGA